MQEIIHPATKSIKTKLALPGSKPLTQRAILIAALTDGVSELSGISIDPDTQALISALHDLGIVIQFDVHATNCIIAGSNGRFPKNQSTISCADSITTAQLLIPICATLPGAYYFQSDARLQQLSLVALLNQLHKTNCQIIPNDATHIPFTLIGTDKLPGGKVVLDENISQASICALLITSVFARSPLSFILPEYNDPSLIAMTTACMAEFGVLSHGLQDQMISIPTPQFYRAHDYTIETDYAIAGYFFAAAAITAGEISIKSTNHIQSCQSSVKFLSILEKMGCHVITTKDQITVKGPENLKGVDIGLRSFSDTFVSLAAIAPFATSPTRISHASNIQKDEQALLAATIKTLVAMGIEVESGADWILIFPGTPHAITVKTDNDPRLAMAFSLMGLKVPDMIIDDADCATAVFPAFYNYLTKLADKGTT